MEVKDATWVKVTKPKDSLGLFYTELAGGRQGKFFWQVLLSSNGKVFRRYFNAEMDLDWEGYEG